MFKSVPTADCIFFQVLSEKHWRTCSPTPLQLFYCSPSQYNMTAANILQFWGDGEKKYLTVSSALQPCVSLIRRTNMVQIIGLPYPISCNWAYNQTSDPGKTKNHLCFIYYNHKCQVLLIWLKILGKYLRKKSVSIFCTKVW